MPTDTSTRSAESSLSKVNDEIAVGADLEFQKRWWRFEKAIWLFFLAVILLDAAGAFGNGFLSKREMKSADGSVLVKYDSVERFSTPSIMTVEVMPAAIHEGKVQIWVADSILKDLGNTEVLPQPEAGALDHHGILYTFPAAPVGDSIRFTLQPKSLGVRQIALRVAGTEQLTRKVLVMP